MSRFRTLLKALRSSEYAAAMRALMLSNGALDEFSMM